MRKKILVSALFAIMMMSFAGCSQASRVSSNLSQEADNFNDVRQLTVINCLQGDTLFLANHLQENIASMFDKEDDD